MIMDWSIIHCGYISKVEIMDAVQDADWQDWRMALKGTSTEYKHGSLRQWLQRKGNTRRAQVQVTNYVNALKRGGIVK